MPGPPPNPNARRRNNRGDWRTLPAHCSRPVPAFPLAGRPAKGQADAWRHLWSLPQAELWHEQNAVRLVGRYVRLMLFVEANPVAGAALLAEVRQLEDRLLLSPSMLLKARCLVADEAEVVDDGQDDGDADVIALYG